MNYETEPLVLMEHPRHRKKKIIITIFTIVILLVILATNIYSVYILYRFSQYVNSLNIPHINMTEVSIYADKIKSIADYLCSEIISC